MKLIPIKHGYSSMVRDARGAILNSEAQILKAEAQFIHDNLGHNTETREGENP